MATEAKKFDVVGTDVLVKASNNLFDTHPALKEKPNMVVVTGARLVMNNETGKKESLEFEFLQQRVLEGRTENILALLHEGDSRWNTGVTKMRVWTTVTKQGAIKALGLPEEFIDSIIAQGADLKDGERLAIMRPVGIINTASGAKAIKIICNETTNVENLPLAIQKQLDGQYGDRYRLQAPTGPNKALENVVDAEGRNIYRWFTFGTEDQKDQMIAGKLSLTRYLEQQKSAFNLGESLVDASAYGLAE